jgi:hypothetical protein
VSLIATAILQELLDSCATNRLKTSHMKFKNKPIQLNWGKLLGFDQVKLAQGQLKSKSGKALMNAKIGRKVLAAK